MLKLSNGYNIANTALAPARKRSRDEDYQYHASPMTSSGGASTSGRGSAEIFSYIIQRNNVEIDAVVHHQTDRLTAELKEVARRGLVAAVAAGEQQAAKVLGNKEAELSKARKMNLLLQEKVHQLGKERQRWMEAAMQSEKVLAAMQNYAASEEAERGGGAIDAESCCFEGDNKDEQINNNGMKKRCKACMENEVSVLLLPCRHVCLCRSCEPKLRRCPVCSAAKNATLNVFLC